MKVIKLRKRARQSDYTHYIVFDETTCGNDEKAITEHAEWLAEEWCVNDSAGQVYGYSMDWEFVLDEMIIKESIKKELGVVSDKITYLEECKNKLVKELNNINNEKDNTCKSA